jgi:hypothetical protein
MVLCPVALAVGCRRCPIFRFCPAKTVIGDYRPQAPAPPPKKPAVKKRGRSR